MHAHKCAHARAPTRAHGCTHAAVAFLRKLAAGLEMAMAMSSAGGGRPGAAQGAAGNGEAHAEAAAAHAAEGGGAGGGGWGRKRQVRAGICASSKRMTRAGPPAPALAVPGAPACGTCLPVCCVVQVVHNVQLVRGRRLYGYHAEEQVFVKIIL